jgi:hypothetical protein
MTEIGVIGPRREDEIIIRKVDPVRSHDLLREIETIDLAQDDPDVPVPGEDAADRPSDVGGRERGGRDLIEEGLEEVLVPLVDDGDVDGLPR